MQSEDIKSKSFFERFWGKKNLGAANSSKNSKNQRSKDSRQVLSVKRDHHFLFLFLTEFLC